VDDEAYTGSGDVGGHGTAHVAKAEETVLP